MTTLKTLVKGILAFSGYLVCVSSLTVKAPTSYYNHAEIEPLGLSKELLVADKSKCSGSSTTEPPGNKCGGTSRDRLNPDSLKELVVAGKGDCDTGNRCGEGNNGRTRQHLQTLPDNLIIVRGGGEHCGNSGCRALPEPDSSNKLLVAGKGQCGGNHCGGGKKLQAPLDGLVIAKG